MNCILGDEMGLGKTLQTLALFAYIKENYATQEPHLVICPLSVLQSWQNVCLVYTYLNFLILYYQ
jgi:SWI/SNF-related matrix-associated actin-dependent regulator of chromatin subfamily A member 5